MKKVLMTLAILIVSVLNIPLSAWADFVDLLIAPPTLYIGTGVGTLNFDGYIQNDPININSNRFDFYQNDSSNKFMSTRSSDKLSPGNLSDIFWSRDGLPTMTIIAVDSIDAGETRKYSTSFAEFGMVKKVLEPSTMLLLGSCLLGLGLFAIKFRK